MYIFIAPTPEITVVVSDSSTDFINNVDEYMFCIGYFKILSIADQGGISAKKYFQYCFKFVREFHTLENRLVSIPWVPW